MPGLRRAALSVAAVVLVAAGCGGSSGSYFPAAGGIYSAPVRPGDALYVGAAVLTAERNDVVTLLGADIVGLDDGVEGEVLLQQGDGDWIGVFRESELPTMPGIAPIGPIDGVRIDPSSRPVQLVMRLKPTTTAGRVTAEGVRLRFRVGAGRTEAQTFPSQVIVCVEASAPAAADCGPEDPDA